VQPLPDTTSAVGLRPLEALRAQVLQTLNGIIDPCSAASAIPAGLVDMGLIRQLSIETGTERGWRCEVKLCVTHALCMMTGVFVSEIERRLGELSDLTDVRVELDHATIWTEELMSEDYRSRLQELRERRKTR
jgi:metal-sulfur cluster biosynthetic enzyme